MDPGASSDLNDGDRELLREAIAASDRLYLKDVQEVAAAIRTADGRIFSAIHFETKVGYATVCGEVAAICVMVAAGHRDMETIVAVWRDPQGRHFLLPPCGRCRDVINEFNPDAWIIVSQNPDYWDVNAIAAARKVRASDLLPVAYRAR